MWIETVAKMKTSMILLTSVIHLSHGSMWICPFSKTSSTNRMTPVAANTAANPIKGRGGMTAGQGVSGGGRAERVRITRVSSIP